MTTTTSEKDSTKPKKRKKRKKKRLSRAKRLAKINKIFMDSAEDYSYIMSNRALKSAHKKFIMNAAYTRDLVASKSGIKSFVGFHKYAFIYAQWVHLVNCCYVPDSPFYPFFGGKGIKLSPEFLDGKTFCLWALKNGLTRKPFMYDVYLQRRDKSKDYSPANCYVTTEESIHKCKSVKQALESVWILKKYEEEHDSSVSYVTYYTRYYMYDMTVEDARSWYYNAHIKGCRYGFSISRFYQSVANKESCSFSTFKSRMHYAHLNGGFTIRPYQMLDPSFDVGAAANQQGKLSYKQRYHREIGRKAREEAERLAAQASQSNPNDVYSIADERDPYSDIQVTTMKFTTFIKAYKIALAHITDQVKEWPRVYLGDITFPGEGDVPEDQILFVFSSGYAMQSGDVGLTITLDVQAIEKLRGGLDKVTEKARKTLDVHDLAKWYIGQNSKINEAGRILVLLDVISDQLKAADVSSIDSATLSHLYFNFDKDLADFGINSSSVITNGSLTMLGDK